MSLAAALILLSAGASFAQPLRSPLPSELRRIQEEIDGANRSLQDAPFREAKRRCLATESSLGQRGTTLSADQISALEPEQRRQYQDDLVSVGVHRERAQKLFDAAIDDTLRYYQLEPIRLSGTLSDGSALSGHTLHWQPRFSDRPIKEESGDDESVQLAFMRPSDGAVVVRQRAFQYPGLLAFTLYHESLHFGIALEQGWRASTDAEVRIQKATLRDAKQTFGLTDHDLRDMIATLAYAQWLEIERRRGNTSPTRPEWIKSIRDNVISQEELLAINLDSAVEPLASIAQNDPAPWSKALHPTLEIFSQSLLLRQLTRQEAARDEADRLARQQEEEQRYRDFLEARQRANDAAWKYLRATMALACSSPDGFERKATAGELVRVDMESLEFFFRMTSSFENSGPGSMSRCQRAMMDALYAANGPVAAGTLAQWARDWRQAHPTLLKIIAVALADAVKAAAGAMTDFLSALGEALAADPSGGSGTGGGGSSRTREDRDRMPSSGVHPGGGEALGQAGAINRRGWGGF